MTKRTIQKIALATNTAESGVDYSPKFGALCPWCGKKTKIYKTTPWDENLRIRYHRCQNDRCALAATGVTVKSIEIDNVAVEKS